MWQERTGGLIQEIFHCGQLVSSQDELDGVYSVFAQTWEKANLGVLYGGEKHHWMSVQL